MKKPSPAETPGFLILRDRTEPEPTRQRLVFRTLAFLSLGYQQRQPAKRLTSRTSRSTHDDNSATCSTESSASALVAVA
jgi:hypothetical protein